MMDKSQFRTKLSKIKGDKEVASLMVTELVSEFLNSRKIWYNKVEGISGNARNLIISDIDYLKNTIYSQFGASIGIDEEKIKLRILRAVRGSKQRKSIKKSGKYRKSL